jgi:superfamily II DNA or RNA helicase
MKVIIGNVQSRLVIGGSDGLCDPNLIDTLREYMSVEVPGSFFANKKLRWHWNGKKYFLTREYGKFATGFLPALLKYIEEEYPDLDVEIIDERGELPRFKREFVAKIGPITITDGYIHQKEMIECLNHEIIFRGQIIPFYRGVVDGATNSGKSAVIAGLFLNIEGDQKMLVVIHRKAIYRELLEFFTQVFGEIGQINDIHYFMGKQVTLAMIQTLSSRIDDPNTKKDLAQFTILACDEVHAGGSKMYSSTLVHCPASVRIGTSGTSFDSNDIISRMIIVGLFGPRLKTVSKREMMDKGISAPVTVYMHLVNTILRQPLVTYDEHIKYLIHESIERVSIMAKIIREKSPVLISVAKTQHGVFIQEQLKQMGISVELTHSKDKDIIPKVDAFRNGEIDCLISTGTLREGVNMPRVKVTIFAEGMMAKISIKQWMGRGERLHESKDSVEFHDFMDIGKFCQTHSLKRLKVYQDENLPIIMDFDKKDLKNMRSIVMI